MVRFLRWIARIWSIVSIVLIIMFIVGERGAGPGSGIEWISFIFFPVGVVGGMINGWRKDALGGVVTVFSLVAFYLVEFIDSGTWPSGPWFVLMAFPGFIYLALWLGTHKERTS